MDKTLIDDIKPGKVLDEIRHHITRLIDLQALGVYLVIEEDNDFYPAYKNPSPKIVYSNFSGQSIFLEFVLQGASADAQGLSRVFPVPVVGLEGLFQSLLFRVFQSFLPLIFIGGIPDSPSAGYTLRQVPGIQNIASA